MDWTDSWELQPLDLELQSFYLFYLMRITSLFTRRGQENTKPRALAMLCSSSSSDLFCPSHPLFFPPPAPISPTLCMVSVPVSGPPCPRREHLWCVIPAALSSQQPAGLCVLGMGMLGWGRLGTGGPIFSLLEGEDAGAVECGVEMQPRSKMCNKPGAGDPESQNPLRAGAEGAQSTSTSLWFPSSSHSHTIVLGWLVERGAAAAGAVGSACPGGDRRVYICTYTLSSTCIVIPTHGSCPRHRGGGQMYSIYFYMYYI